MAKLSIKAGTTSKTVKVFVQDNSVTTGAGLTGLVYNTSGLTAYYIKEGDASTTSITLATATLGTWATGGFIVVDGTNMPGVYELSIPNAALSSAKSCIIYLQGATHMAPVVLEIELTAIDNQSTGFGLVDVSSNVVQWNGTNVSSPATAGIPDVNIKNMNNVAATSITTINANIGETQPINFTGTGGSALVKSDMTDIAGSAVSTSSAQIGVNVVNWSGGAVPSPNVTGVPLVDAKYLLGTIFSTPATAGIMDINLKNIANAAVSTSTAQLGVNVVKINAQTASASGTVTFPNATLASTTNITGGTITTVTNLTNAPTSGDFTSTMKTSIGTAVAASAVASVTGNVGGNVVGSVASVTGAVGSVTSGVTVTTNNDKTGYALSSTGNNSVATAVLTNTMTESYAPVNSAMTLTQAAYGLFQMYAQQSISGTTMTVLKRDQSTTAKTFTLNSATTPTAITEAS